MRLQKPGNSLGPGPEVAERQKIAKKRATQRVSSWTVQNEIRSVLGRVSASAARRIFDSANSKEIRAYCCVRCSEREREHSEHDVQAQVPR